MFGGMIREELAELVVGLLEAAVLIRLQMEGEGGGQAFKAEIVLNDIGHVEREGIAALEQGNAIFAKRGGIVVNRSQVFEQEEVSLRSGCAQQKQGLAFLRIWEADGHEFFDVRYTLKARHNRFGAFAAVDVAGLIAKEIGQERVAPAISVAAQKEAQRLEESAQIGFRVRRDYGCENPPIRFAHSWQQFLAQQHAALAAVGMTEACNRSRQGRIVTRLEDMAEELAKLRDELKYQQGFLAYVMKKLGNENFVSKAPAKVIEMERKKQADAESKIKSIEESIAALTK